MRLGTEVELSRRFTVDKGQAKCRRRRCHYRLDAVNRMRSAVSTEVVNVAVTPPPGGSACPCQREVQSGNVMSQWRCCWNGEVTEAVEYKPFQ